MGFFIPVMLEKIYKLYLNSTGISTDTRSIQSGNLFFALTGENYDANKFIQQAFDKGASAVVATENKDSLSNVVVVEDALSTLQKLATYHRRQLKLPVLALTGSNGKTTTKELMHRVLAKKYKTTATTGNLNNHIGVPLTLLAIPSKTEFAVVEMGANHQKEIEALSAIAQPDYGYITNYGKAHLEGFGGVEGVIKGKSELYDYLKNHNGIAFVNEDDNIQLEKTQQQPRLLISKNYSFDESNGFVTIYDEDGNKYVSNLKGMHNAKNIRAAIAVGKHFNVPVNKIQQAIAEYIPKQNRSQVITKNDKVIYLDAYNANPSSVHAVLDFYLNEHKEHTFMVVLGDMLELGEVSAYEHKMVVKKLMNSSVAVAYLVGPNYIDNCPKDERFKAFSGTNQLIAYLKECPVKVKNILIKGSRKWKLEQVVDFL